YGAWPQVGVPAGIVLGTGTYALLSATLTDQQFLAWGWRVPFLASALIIALGMWIRLTVTESPIFQETLDAKSTARMPVLDALKTYPKEIALAAGSAQRKAGPFRGREGGPAYGRGGNASG
ncbi:MAG: MFS transporter, partial [Methyloceanibacter sp.]